MHVAWKVEAADAANKLGQDSQNYHVFVGLALAEVAQPSSFVQNLQVVLRVKVAAVCHGWVVAASAEAFANHYQA